MSFARFKRMDPHDDFASTPPSKWPTAEPTFAYIKQSLRKFSTIFQNNANRVKIPMRYHLFIGMAKEEPESDDFRNSCSSTVDCLTDCSEGCSEGI